MSRRTLLLWSCVGLVGVLSGCGSSLPWETVYPAAGALTYEGQPLPGAQIILYPIDAAVPESIRPTATTKENGQFEISTHAEGDGAPAGEYRLAVVWHPLIQSEDGNVRGENYLPVKYSKPETSELTVHVDEGVTSIPTIDLKNQ